MKDAFAALQSEAGAYPDGVRLWMAMMAVSFFSGIVFVPWKNGARWVVGIMALTALGLVIGKALFPELSRTAIGTTLHLALWPVLIAALWNLTARRERRAVSPSLVHSAYTAWLIWVSALIVVSLVFDLRVALTWL